MKRHIKLEETERIGSLVESEPFFLLAEKSVLEIEFDTDLKTLLLVSVRNGDITKQVVVRDKTLLLPDELIHEGELEIIVSTYEKARLSHKWHCEPIVIVKPNEETFEGYSKIDEIKAQTTQQIEALTEKVSALTLQVEDLQAQIKELWQAQEC